MAGPPFLQLSSILPMDCIQIFALCVAAGFMFEYNFRGIQTHKLVQDEIYGEQQFQLRETSSLENLSSSRTVKKSTLGRCRLRGVQLPAALYELSTLAGPVNLFW